MNFCKHIDKRNNINYEVITRYQFEMLLFSWKSHTKHVSEPQSPFSHHCSIVCPFCDTMSTQSTLYQYLIMK